nr:hypothetical protein [Coxiella endosymbiont of Ornithodoros maritimus]
MGLLSCGLENTDAIKSGGFQQVTRMSEAKHGKTMMSPIIPVFRFFIGLLSYWARETA